MSTTTIARIGMKDALVKPQGFRFFGLTTDTVIKYFFGGNAFLAILVLGLITVFLFREGFGFVDQNRKNLQIYREAGLEYIDIVRHRVEAHAKVVREINQARLLLFKQIEKKGESLEQINAALAPLDAFSGKYSDAAQDLRGLVSDAGDIAVDVKQRASEVHDRLEQQQMLLAAGRTTEAAAVVIPKMDFVAERKPILATLAGFPAIAATLRTNLIALISQPDPGAALLSREQMDGIRKSTREYLTYLDSAEPELAAWNPQKPVGYFAGLTNFLTNSEWQTASFWQDWYGVIPLFIGSLFVSAIALALAVPLGICGAIYVNQIAHPREAGFIKPAIEFIAAFPSVVLGFFGVAILGETIRVISHWHALAWVPFFPISERLNATTAGILLGLMAVPTIFSLAEDSINNVPVHFKEASFALGASRLQTLIKITIPAALSGIIAAVLLGFGRVIGETMVVLLCAGNRIKIPDFTEGLGAIFQPVHTMTGIIAQETGEVPQGSIHWRALFMVAIVLFVIALAINLVAQKIVKKYRISVG